MTERRTLIHNGVVITLDPKLGDLEGADILVEGEEIVAVGHDLGVEDAEVIDAEGCIVIPGFVDTHRHTWQAPVRNLASDWSLLEYFAGLHNGLSPHFRPQDTYAGNLLGATESIDAGVTTLVDWSHNLRTPEHADAAVAALRDGGGRAVFAHGGGADQWDVIPPNPLPHPEDARRVRDEHFSSEDGLVTMALALRGPRYTTREVARHDWQLARDLELAITVHVGDGEYGESGEVAWLNSEGLLNPRTTYVHCNTSSDEELRLIADSGATASVATDVEMQMGHGWPATGRLLDVGIRPSLSIDVCSSISGSFFSLMRTTLSTQRAIDNETARKEGTPLGTEPPRLSCRDVLEFATIEGARAAGLDHKIGTLTPGKQADIVVVRADGISMTPLNNPLGALIYNGHSGLVDTVMVGGQVVKRDAVLVEESKSGRARKLAEETRDHLLVAAADSQETSDIKLGGEWRPSRRPPID